MGTYRTQIGIVEFILGVIALAARFSFINIPILGSSYPQAIAALATGALLARAILHKIPYANHLAPYQEHIGGRHRADRSVLAYLKRKKKTA